MPAPDHGLRCVCAFLRERADVDLRPVRVGEGAYALMYEFNDLDWEPVPFFVCLPPDEGGDGRNRD